MSYFRERFLYAQRFYFLAVVWILLPNGAVLRWMLCCWGWECLWGPVPLCGVNQAAGPAGSAWSGCGRDTGGREPFDSLWFPLQPCVTCTPWERSSSSHGTRPQSWNPENGKEMYKNCIFAAFGLGGFWALLSGDNHLVKSYSDLWGLF